MPRMSEVVRPIEARDRLRRSRRRESLGTVADGAAQTAKDHRGGGYEANTPGLDHGLASAHGADARRSRGDDREAQGVADSGESRVRWILLPSSVPRRTPGSRQGRADQLVVAADRAVLHR